VQSLCVSKETQTFTISPWLPKLMPQELAANHTSHL
jgi:hypothetical protein